MRAPRTKLLALLLALVALAVAGCGGSEVSSDEVPGNPPALAVPSDGDIGGSNADSSSSASGSNSSGAGTTDSTGTGTTTGSTGTAAPTATTAPSTTDGTSGGTTAPTTPSTDDTATNDQAPPAGSDAQQFENFCEQNAGAC